MWHFSFVAFRVFMTHILSGGPAMRKVWLWPPLLEKLLKLLRRSFLMKGKVYYCYQNFYELNLLMHLLPCILIIMLMFHSFTKLRCETESGELLGTKYVPTHLWMRACSSSSQDNTCDSPAVSSGFEQPQVSQVWCRCPSRTKLSLSGFKSSN